MVSLDLTQSLPDGPPQSSFERTLFGPKPSLREMIDTIAVAAKDSASMASWRVSARAAWGWPRSQELRDAIAAFRASGKFAYAYADSMGELGGGTASYYLASAFGEIWLQPYSDLGLVGLRIEQPFFHDTLEKIGVTPRMDHREEYKSAMNMFTETKMTPAHREEMEGLLHSLIDQIVRGIAQSRKLSEADVRALIDKGPFTRTKRSPPS